jgi:hypothetical protein
MGLKVGIPDTSADVTGRTPAPAACGSFVAPGIGFWSQKYCKLHHISIRTTDVLLRHFQRPAEGPIESELRMFCSDIFSVRLKVRLKHPFEKVLS